MTIDVHSHLFVRGFQNPSAVSPFWDAGAHEGRDPAEALAEAKRRTLAEPDNTDPDGSRHLARMDEAGISRSILLHLDYGLLFGEGEFSIERQNRYVGEVAAVHPDRFVWFCGVDPRRNDAAAIFETCVTEWGAKGLKLYPTTGFLPADREAYPLYELASAWGIPITFHMGPENPPFHNNGNAHASVLLRVLVDFPDLTVIAAHLGYEFWRDLIALGKVRDNILCDFSAWQGIARTRFPQFCHILRKFLDEFGVERVMFGTDAPILEEAMSSREWVDMIAALPESSATDVHFTEAEVDALLEGNARRLLDAIPDGLS